MGDRQQSGDRDRTTRSFPKKFYTTAEASRVEGGYTLLLDGMQVRTPKKARFVVPLASIAHMVAEEFGAQDTQIVPATMPVTRLSYSAIDTVGTAMDAVADEVAAYAGSDLLCYRAETPERLAQRQAEHWDPLLEWAEGAMGARLHKVAGIMHRQQPDDSIDAIRARARAHDCFGLCALHTITTLTGSAVIALAIADGALDPETAWAAATVDEDWQIEHWGEDMEASVQRARRRRDFDAACRLIEALRAA